MTTGATGHVWVGGRCHYCGIQTTSQPTGTCPGRPPASDGACSHCDGSGMVVGRAHPYRYDCPICHGTGRPPSPTGGGK